MNPAEKTAWLKKLQEELWEQISATHNSYARSREKRDLTEDEWSNLSYVLDTPNTDLVYHLSTIFGLTLCLCIYKLPTYPGTPPEHLLTLNQEQIPNSSLQGATLGGSGDSWKAAWDLFTKHTHSPRNTEKLAFCEMPPPEDRTHYMY